MEYLCSKCGTQYIRTQEEVAARSKNLFFRNNYSEYCDSCLNLIDYHGKYSHQIKDNQLHLNLLENAFDFLNCAISHVITAEVDNNILSWKHAIVNIVISIELFLKEILRQENRLLIYADLDHYRKIDNSTKTVSWTVAIERVKIITGGKIDAIDRGRLGKAQKLRNQMLHYDVEIIPQKAYRDFSNLLDFTVQLYKAYLEEYTTKPIEKFIYPKNWEKEKIIIRYFGDEFTNYKGYVVYKEFMDEQKFSHILLKGEKYKRIKFGDEPNYVQYDDYPGYYKDGCHDCDAIEGLYHSLGCDVEVCPRCNGQLLSCECLRLLDDIAAAESKLCED